MIVRLRSVSDKEENVTLTYPRCQPSATYICNLGEEPSEEFNGEITMPPYAMTTILLKF